MTPPPNEQAPNEPARASTERPADRLRAKLAERGATGLMAHLVAGFPNRAATIDAARAIEAAGADVLELQFPFSDPLADGPVVLQACQDALDAGTDHAAFLGMLEEITRSIRIPTVVMTYANVPFVRGFASFARELAAAGATGLIVPDLPHTEPEFAEFRAALGDAGLSYVPVVAPTSTPKTIAELAEVADTFLYVVVRLGVTGRASTIDDAVRTRLAEISAITPHPLAAGFGIQSGEQVRSLAGHARLAVVGSKIVTTIREHADAPGPAVESLVRSLVGD